MQVRDGTIIDAADAPFLVYQPNAVASTDGSATWHAGGCASVGANASSRTANGSFAGRQTSPTAKAARGESPEHALKRRSSTGASPGIPVSNGSEDSARRLDVQHSRSSLGVESPKSPSALSNSDVVQHLGSSSALEKALNKLQVDLRAEAMWWQIFAQGGHD